MASNNDHPRLYEENVPQDLWMEIFVRASIESLLRVKYVCRRWHTLITNPIFIKKHLEFQKTMSKNKGCFLLQHHELANKITKYILFDESSIIGTAAALSPIQRKDVVKYSFENTKKGKIVNIVGPVNGLYCVYGHTDRIVIWNPATKGVNFVPIASECLPGNCSSYECEDYFSIMTSYIVNSEVGFGINEDDYKVVMICEYVNESNEDDLYYYRLLYTTNTNKWRIIEDENFKESDYKYDFYSNNTFLNGFYYWYHHQGRFVLSFDMGKEVFGKIYTPDLCLGCACDVVLHNDRLILLVLDTNMSNIIVSELEVKSEIWIKKRTIVIENPQPFTSSLGLWKNESELILLMESQDRIGQTILYNTVTRELINIGPRGHIQEFKSLGYHESLISLSGEVIENKGDSSLDIIMDFLNGDSTYSSSCS